MNNATHRLLGLVGFAWASAGWTANAPCDASLPVKGYRAEISLEGRYVVLKSSTPQCSVIEWTLDGRGRQTTVLDGIERLELLTTQPKQLSVESCTQVKDLRDVQAADPVRTPVGVIFRPDMQSFYPKASVALQEEGVTRVRACYNWNGRVAEAEVLESSGFARLDAAAISASYEFRLRPGTEDGVAVPGCVVLPIRFELVGVTKE